MIKRISNNRFVDAALKLMIFSSIVHIVISVVSVVVKQDINRVNYFDVIDLETFLPALAGDITATFVSLVVLVLFYIIIFLFF